MDDCDSCATPIPPPRPDHLRLLREWIQVGQRELSRSVKDARGSKWGEISTALSPAAVHLSFAQYRRASEVYSTAFHSAATEVQAWSPALAGLLADAWIGLCAWAARTNAISRAIAEASTVRLAEAEDEARLAAREAAAARAACEDVVGKLKGELTAVRGRLVQALLSRAGERAAPRGGTGFHGGTGDAPPGLHARARASSTLSEGTDGEIGAAEALAEENLRLQQKTRAANDELEAARGREGRLEEALAEARDALERAELERDEGASRLRSLTPRPGPARLEVAEGKDAGVVEMARAALDAALDACGPSWPSRELAEALAGARPPEGRVPPPADAVRALAEVGAPADALERVIDARRMSTAGRVERAEAEAERLRGTLLELEGEIEVLRAAERRRAEVILELRKEEIEGERPNPISEYVKLLEKHGEKAWESHLVGMGIGPDVPKVFRSASKIRNKNLSKRETEKLVKEIWRERLADPQFRSGRAPPLAAFLDASLRKRLGIASAVTEVAYALLFGLWRFRWDADCELFLMILSGEAHDDAYLEQVILQESLDEMMELLEKASSSGGTPDTISKADLKAALHAFFRVGERGGKSKARFELLQQSLDEAAPGARVMWRTLFQEDREFNQGPFAEALRDQYLEERLERAAAREAALRQAADEDGLLDFAAVASAIMLADSNIGPDDARAAAELALAGNDRVTPVVGARRLARGVAKQEALASATVQRAERRAGSSYGAEVLRGIEAVRLRWIAQVTNA